MNGDDVLLLCSGVFLILSLVCLYYLYRLKQEVDRELNSLLAQRRRQEALLRKAAPPSDSQEDFLLFSNQLNTLQVFPDQSELSSCYAIIGEHLLIGSREYQQDAIRSAVIKNENGGDLRRAVGLLADGMGGMEGGEKASNQSVDTLLDDYRLLEEGSNITSFLRHSIAKLDAMVFNLKNDSGQRLGAGTTLVGVILEEDKLYWASVGDSRIYIIREGEIARMTTDHNLLTRLMKQVEAGKMSLEEAMADKQREALTSYIGIGGIEQIDLSEKPLQLKTGDIILLCSDGLYRSLSDEEILEKVRQYNRNMDEMAYMLATAAVQKSSLSHDNTSVVVIRYVDQTEENLNQEKEWIE